MKIRFLAPVAAAGVAVGILGLPGAALAAGGDTAHLAALNDRDKNGKVVEYPIHPGETVPVVAGVVNQGDQPVDGIVVNARLVDDLNLPAESSNCLYYVDSNLHGAWCEIDGPLAPGAKFALSPLHVSAAKDATNPGSSLMVSFYSKRWADAQGGVEALAKADAGRGTTPAAGTGGTLSLTPAPDLPLPAEPKRIGFVPVKLIVPSSSPSSPSTGPGTGTGSPSHPATSPATASASAGGTAGQGAHGTGGGLPITGSKATVVAGLGAALLAAGGAIFFVTRRRRSTFVA